MCMCIWTSINPWIDVSNWPSVPNFATGQVESPRRHRVIAQTELRAMGGSRLEPTVNG